MAAWAAIGQAIADTAMAGMARNDAQKQQRLDRELQKEFAQHGVRWRVEDAKAAGLHPLHALGAQVPSYSPSFTSGPDMSHMGQSIGGALAGVQTKSERAQSQLEKAALLSGLAESDARRGLLEAQAAEIRARHSGGMPENLSGAFQGVAAPERAAASVLPGMVDVIPAQQPTVSSEGTSVAAGDPALWRRFQLQDGRPIYLPGGMTGDASEALESLGESPMLMMTVLSENERRNPGFMRWITDEYVPGLKRSRRFTADRIEEIANLFTQLGRGWRYVRGQKFRSGRGF